MYTATEHEEKRGDVERTFSTQRDTREKQYLADKEQLEADYRADLATIEQDRIDAFVAAGLNSDGSEPYGRPTG